MPNRVSRRLFLASSAAAAAGGSVRALAAEPAASASVHREPARDLPIVEQADVVVCGAGPAGVSAAIAAARSGAKTRLLEVNGCLGGIWTAGLLCWILDASNKTGLMQEYVRRLEERRAARRFSGSIGYDVEKMKLLLEELCLEAGVSIQLHTRLVAAAGEGGRLKLAVTESKSGRQAWGAKVFVDATGDGDLAAYAGCGFDYGREGSGEIQPMSMIVLLTGIDQQAALPCLHGLAELQGEKQPKQRLLEEFRRAGVEPSYMQPTLFYHLRDGLYCMMANHEYGVSALDADQVTQATLRARAEVHKLVEALRSLGGAWKDLELVATPEHIGVREARRIRGRYQLTRDDLLNGARHDDAVCRVNFPVDVHSTDPNKDKGIMREGVRAKPYDIPYRALVARDIEGLLMAGRDISGDFIAHSSYRVTGNAVAMGEAAGAAAAVAAASGRPPHELPWPELRAAIEAVAKEG